MSANHRIIALELDQKSVVRSSPLVEREREIAILDLLHENRFVPLECPDSGPYQLHLGIKENRLILDIQSENGHPLTQAALSVAPFRGIVRDYFMICDSYYKAIGHSSPTQIEAIDMGRRGLHNEGAEMLREQLARSVEVDTATARRLFTLLCILHIRS